MKTYRPAKSDLPQIKANGHLVTQDGLKSGKPVPELESLVTAGILIVDDVDLNELKAKAEKEQREAYEAQAEAERLEAELEEAKAKVEKEEKEAVDAAKEVEQVEDSVNAAPKTPVRRKRGRKPRSQ